jgi:hypothetical protein
VALRVAFIFKKMIISLITNTLRKLFTVLSAAILLPIAWCVSHSVSNVTAVSTNPACSAETAHSAYDFINSIGINVHLNYFDTAYGDFPLVQRELKSLGIRHLRDGVHLQNSDYNKMLYGRWVQLGRIGIRFDAVLDPRSNIGPLNGRLLDQIDQLSGHSIEYFEGPNELDVSNLPDWNSLDQSYQKSIYASVASMTDRRSIKVIGPSMALARNRSLVGDISEFIDQGNLHPYPSAQIPSIVFPEQIDLARSISGRKAIYFTESGYHNALKDHSDQPAISELAAAKYIPRLFLENYARGIPITYLYEFMDETPDPGLTHFQMHWGLIRADGTEKPAYTALKNLIAELGDDTKSAHPRQLDWSLSTKNENTHHLLLEKSTGEFDLVLWQESPSYDYRRQTEIVNVALTTTLTLCQQASGIALYEPTVQNQPLHIYTNVTRVPLQIPDHPLVVKIWFQ